MAKKKSFWERYALKQLSVQEQTVLEDELYILSTKELTALKKIRINTFIKAGLAGVLGVALLYIPYHVFGESLFPKRTFFIPWIELDIELEIEFLVYSLVLVLVEIYYLTYVNIHAVSAIAKACGCPSKSDPYLKENVDSLVNVGLEKKQKDLKKLGINPYDGLSKVGVWIFQTLVKLKAAVSGFLWKLIVKKLLGRYALRMLVDLLGAPLYAAWNIYASRKVMNEARVRVMAPPLINKFTTLLHREFGNNPEFKGIIYDAMQAISTTKRSFHYNHFLLASSLLQKFEIEILEKPKLNSNFLKDIDELSQEIQNSVAKLILFGIIIDGGLTTIEKRSINRLKSEGVLNYSMDEINEWSKDFFDGKGLDHFFER